MNTDEQKGIFGMGCFGCFGLICLLGVVIKIGEWFWKGCLYINTLCKGHLLSSICVLCLVVLVCFLFRRNLRMFERLMMSADEKEFAKITRDLSREKYVVLKTYFKATRISAESASKFLASCRGVAFLDAYTKEKIIDNIAISKLILDVEREEQIVACAVDILKSY
jgi:hypothetical protein